MASRDPEIRAAVTRKAQAAERERLRDLARQQLAAQGGVFSPEDVEQRADELEREKLSAAGKKGARRRAARLAQVRRWEAMHAELVEQAECWLDILREAAPVDPDTCDHSWPGDLDGAHCETCMLPYADWSEPEIELSVEIVGGTPAMAEVIRRAVRTGRVAAA